MNTLVHRFVNNDINQAGCVESKVWVKKRGGLRQIVFEIAFPQSARPTLQYISPEFGYRSPLQRPHPGENSYKL